MAREPVPFDEEGRLIAGKGPHLVNPACRFGGEVRSVGDLKRSQTNRAAVVRTPANLPTSDHFATIIGMCPDADNPGCLAMFTAHHEEAYEQLAVREEREKLGLPL